MSWENLTLEDLLKLKARFETWKRVAAHLSVPKSTLYDQYRRLQRERGPFAPNSWIAPTGPWGPVRKPKECSGSWSPSMPTATLVGSSPSKTTKPQPDPSVKGHKILVIPDSHAHPDYDNDRYDALGALIQEEAPDIVIDIGDFFDMPSLSSYDKGTKGFEGRRYKRDIEAGIDAQEILGDRMRKMSREPRLVRCLGNHEHRIDRAVNSSAELEGTIGTSDLESESFGWEEYPFQHPFFYGGIGFCHYFSSGIMNRPIGGINIGRSLVTKLHMSAVQGHSHVFDHSENTRPDGQKIFGLSVGCYTHRGMREDWNRGSEYMSWRGVVILGDIDGNGYYDDFRCITQRKMMRIFG